MMDMKRIFKGKGINLVIALSLLILPACGDEGASRPDIANPRQQIKHVKVTPVTAESMESDLEYVGVLSAHLKVSVAAEIGGTIEHLSFERGAGVKKGDVLAKISTRSIRLEVQQAEAVLAVAESNLRKMEKGSRPEEIRIAMAAVVQAEAAVNEAENNFKRIKELHAYNAISNSEYDSARMVVDTARANLASARQQLELSKQGPRTEDREAARAGLRQAQAALAISKDRLRKSILLSPADGIIAFRHVEQGEVVGPGTVITQVVDNRRMKIELSLGERDISILEKRKRFAFTVDAIPREEFTCQLASISPTADQSTRSFPLELSVDNPDPRMADGMTVRVNFPIANQKRSIKVPSAWLTEEKGRLGLFVVEDGRASFKKVKLGSYYEKRVEILSGLNENALVITTPAGLKTGDEVKF